MSNWQPIWCSANYGFAWLFNPCFQLIVSFTHVTVVTFEIVTDCKLPFIKLKFSYRLTRLAVEANSTCPQGHRTSIFTCPIPKLTCPRQSDLGFSCPDRANKPFVSDQTHQSRGLTELERMQELVDISCNYPIKTEIQRTQL